MTVQVTMMMNGCYMAMVVGCYRDWITLDELGMVGVGDSWIESIDMMVAW